MGRNFKMPSNIKIGGLIYTLTETDNLTRDFDALGRSCCNDTALEIESTLAPQLKKQTLIHEILEQANFLYELKLPHSVITTLDAVLYQVLVDNPDLIDYMREGS